MGQETLERLEVSGEFSAILKKSMAKRDELLASRKARSSEMPLKFWNQQAHFTTPASGTPEKAIRCMTATAASYSQRSTARSPKLRARTVATAAR